MTLRMVGHFFSVCKTACTLAGNPEITGKLPDGFPASVQGGFAHTARAQPRVLHTCREFQNCGFVILYSSLTEIFYVNNLQYQSVCTKKLPFLCLTWHLQ
jgi:hypothetical protein